jgi:hypothetical protein
MTDDPYMQLLASDGWQDVAGYVPSREYCYVKGFAAYARQHPSVAIGRRGKYETSYWFQPNGEPLALAVRWWKPFPTDDGSSPHQRWVDFFGPSGGAGAYVRPPEEVFEPAGVDAKLKKPARELLSAMFDGAVLRERAWRWTEWTLIASDESSGFKITEHGINPLRKCAFIERDGVLPPGRLPHWFEFNWRVTDAGKAWIEANTQ